MNLLLAFIGLSATGLLLMVNATFVAPEGEEDTKGFHFVVSESPVATKSVQHAVEHGGLSVAGR